ncbi:MAG: hypothetical protein M3M96_07060 [Candidatus Eremiobacteraeota bacterium]|nr:hypothetical protein [Candidatus Eremiobacteraeota bacterium]
MKHIFFALVIASLLAASPIAVCAAQPVRPPNGIYVYSIGPGTGPAELTSTIKVDGRGPIFVVSEETKLPNGAIATTRSTWSSATLLPLTFDLHQGRIRLRARLTPAKLTFIGKRVSFARLPGTTAILPSVGLISTDLMFAYFVNAHPGESLTIAEIQNRQSVLVRPSSASPASIARDGHTAIAITKQERYGDAGEQEQIVAWLNRQNSVIDEEIANPGDARIKLLHFTPATDASGMQPSSAPGQ